MNTNMANIYEITRQRIEASQEEAVRALVRTNQLLEDEVQMLQAETHLCWPKSTSVLIWP